MSWLDKLHQDASRLAAAAESQAAAIAKLIPNVEWLQDRYVEKLDEIIRLRADLAAERVEVERLRAALAAIESESMTYGDGCACSDVYVRSLDRVWKMAHDALPATGGPS